MPPAGGRIAILLVGGRGQPLAWNSGFADLFGDPARLIPRDEQGQELPRGGWPQAHVLRGETSYTRVQLDLASGGRRPFDVTGYPLGTGDGGSLSRGVLVVEEASPPDPAGDIAGLVSHELRTPLTVLHALLQLTDRALREGHDSLAQRYVADALAETRQLDALTGELLLATRLSSGQVRLHRERLSLGPLVRQVCARAQMLGSRPAIQVTALSDAIEVDADRSYLEQMLLQLFINALIHASMASQIDVTVRHEGGEAAVEVHDQGRGLSGKRLERLTEPFYQARRGDRPSRGGLGLGLFVCRELAQLHGGRLAIHAPADGGTSFTLWLPMAPDTSPETAVRIRLDVSPARRTPRS